MMRRSAIASLRLLTLCALVAAGGAGASRHVVARGETLTKIASDHHVPIAALQAANDIDDPDDVRLGANLRIPDANAAEVARAVPAAKRSAAATYAVRRGDTLSGIATKFGTSVGDLVRRNELARAGVPLVTGRVLRVPGRDGSDADSPPCPVRGAGRFDFSDSFGAPREGHRRHAGNDVFAKRGTAIVASADGTLRRVTGSNVGLGYYLDGDDGTTYYGAHLQSLAAPDGRVARGAVIGAVGSSGNARGTPPHLHFEVKSDGRSVDPYPLLRRWCG